MVCHNLLFTNFFLCDPDLMPCSIYNYQVTTGDLACEQQMHFRSSLLSLQKKIFRRERSNDRKCVCCSQATGDYILSIYLFIYSHVGTSYRVFGPLSTQTPSDGYFNNYLIVKRSDDITKLNLWNYGICWQVQKEQDEKCPLLKNQPIGANWWQDISVTMLR